MSEKRNITIGVDGSPDSIRALDWAARYARTHGAPLEVLTAVGWPGDTAVHGGYRIAELRDAARVDGQHTLDRMLERVTAAMPGLPVSGRLSNEPPAKALLHASSFSGLVIVGCRGLNPAASLVLGSVSTVVTAHAECPVVVVRSDRQPGPDAPVVAGLTGTERDAATLDAAFAEADLAGAPLTVAHAWTDATLVGVFGASVVPSWIEARAEADALVRRQLAGWREKYPAATVRTLVQRDGPAAMLQALAPEAGLVVVGSRGRGGFAGMLLGSVARRMVQHASAPVLVVRG
ncbi:universal stress protein [Cryptosporangium sp. NPDC051539]|uniref:universal stress protein n=1 Tax=Cryptosporangium sp. NPDC051539 TaxID=3363962 RepID=UPI0037BCFF05